MSKGPATIGASGSTRPGVRPAVIGASGAKRGVGPSSKGLTKGSRATAKPPIVIAGFGKLGGALALGLAAKGWPVTAVAASVASRRSAKQLGIPLASAEDLAAARLCLFAVQDSAVGARVAELEPELSADCALVHCAGALSLEALGQSAAVLRHPLGSFHPLAAVSSPQSSLAGRSAALSATRPALLSTLRKMARDLELVPLVVPEARRAAYHAGAVLSAGGAVALLSTAVRALQHAGLAEDEALRALLPLMRSALDGVEQRGLRKGLTGPVARGDAGVVKAHVEALPPDTRELYLGLSKRMLELAELEGAERSRLMRALSKPRRS